MSNKNIISRVFTFFFLVLLRVLVVGTIEGFAEEHMIFLTRNIFCFDIYIYILSDPP